MKPWQAWFLHISNISVGLTGLAYAYFIYLAAPLDEYSNVSSPWQPLMHELHILTAPLLIFGIGMIWMTHALAKIRGRDPNRRRTGIFLISLAWPMIFSGVVVQIVTSPEASRFWKIAHLAASLLWLAGYLFHQLQSRSEGSDA